MNQLPTATEAAALIRTGRLTSQTLVSACLDRIRAREHEVGAWTFLDPDRALAAARAADATTAPRGPLHGVPIGVKDIIDTVDMPTGLGFAPYATRQPMWDAACVAAYRRAGAIVLGKTVSTEFAYFAAGKTRNPHDLLATPGGSSSGSAAAVADGMVPLALGSQTAASLVRPAAFCGIAGYKSSHGEFSLSGIRPLSESLDSLGVLARSVADLALARRVMLMAASSEPSPPLAPAVPRIALCRTARWAMVEPAAQAALEQAAAALAAAGARVEEFDLPPHFDTLIEAQQVVMAYEAARNYAFEMDEQRSDLSGAFVALCERGETTARADYLTARGRLRAGRDELARVAAPYAALLAPPALGEAPDATLGTGDPLMSRLWTALHAPAVCLPIARGPRGRPLALQLVAPQGHDDALLAVAAWAEQRLAYTG